LRQLFLFQYRQEGAKGLEVEQTEARDKQDVSEDKPDDAKSIYVGSVDYSCELEELLQFFSVPPPPLSSTFPSPLPLVTHPALYRLFLQHYLLGA